MTDDLTAQRRDRVIDAMRAADIDVLVLGRQDDTNYASGMRRLWTAGTRPFGAGCIVVAATGRSHVLSSWDAGMPSTMTFEDLYPITWNPRIMADSLAGIDGLATAHRIGVDETSPSFARAAARFAPDAEIVTADRLMADVRRTKLPAEIELIRTACAVAWAGVDAVVEAAGAAPGDDDSSGLCGAAVQAMAAAGSSIPAGEPRVDRRGEAIVVDLGVIVDGYEGGVGGRFVGGRRDDPAPLVDACRAGATHADLGSAALRRWRVRGCGMGYEQPVIDATLGRHEILEAGMVVSVTDGDHREVVAVTDGPPDVLSHRPADTP